MELELHNIVEDRVISMVDIMFNELSQKDTEQKFCTCNKCKMDVICYALNRLAPHYILSSRGASRVQNENFEYQQLTADMVVVIKEGLRRVSHNMRPNFTHSAKTAEAGPDEDLPVYNVPAIMGRVFNGDNFAPLLDALVELLWNGKPVPMKDGNWQNPYIISSKNEGNYSFWPAPDMASGADKHKIFEYTLKVSSDGFETMNHFFKIPVASEIRQAGSFTLNRTFKLPDLYLFQPGEAEKNGYLD